MPHPTPADHNDVQNYVIGYSGLIDSNASDVAVIAAPSSDAALHITMLLITGGAMSAGVLHLKDGSNIRFSPYLSEGATLPPILFDPPWVLSAGSPWNWFFEILDNARELTKFYARRRAEKGLI